MSTPRARRQDSDRTCRLLLDAALEEFAARGFAGARVQDIADRAGVNKQLISYHFGGKEGLYRALLDRWYEREAEFNTPDVRLPDLAVRYLHQSLDDPRGTLLELRRNLDAVPTGAAPAAPPGIPGDEDTGLADLRRRQEAGELAAGLDPAAVMLALMAMVSAPVTRPLTVRSLFGLDPASPEFREHYTGQLHRIVALLAGEGGTVSAARRERGRGRAGSTGR
ncbi:TetR/AcrR family transcriptional regulator [Actinomadura parmotrematis]|uniref:TetR family transcriptional regulator n=1 Tax=Actinomadura parmotrematis TaxID=2864039 RepID=A0ABS7FUL7_9ACTN|nr:TetR family transcriptional regulator [Actinomadura parmotrematis]MBW8483880.1 TetR family transcriptional regulator [Actinomadura parmotrematis]